MTVDEARVLGALSGVRDPELGEPITELGFVSNLEVEGEAVYIRLRLPTYFCAPNFAYLMVADAKEAALSVPGIDRAKVILEEHYASEDLNTSVNARGGFDDAFPGETESSHLEELRTISRRKSFVSRQERLCRTLLSEGRSLRSSPRCASGRWHHRRISGSTWSAARSSGLTSRRRHHWLWIRTVTGCQRRPSSSTSGSRRPSG